jgi:hypothetical protein
MKKRGKQENKRWRHIRPLRQDCGNVTLRGPRLMRLSSVTELSEPVLSKVRRGNTTLINWSVFRINGA